MRCTNKHQWKKHAKARIVSQFITQMFSHHIELFQAKDVCEQRRRQANLFLWIVPLVVATNTDVTLVDFVLSRH